MLMALSYKKDGFGEAKDGLEKIREMNYISLEKGGT